MMPSLAAGGGWPPKQSAQQHDQPDKVGNKPRYEQKNPGEQGERAGAVGGECGDAAGIERGAHARDVSAAGVTQQHEAGE